MSIFTDLLFLHGHIANVALAKELAGPDVASPEAVPGSRMDGQAVGQDRRHGPVSATRNEADITPAACINR